MSDKPQKEIIDYNEEIQKLLLEFMISDPAAMARSQSILKPEYWNDRLRASARYIIDYTDQYRLQPTVDMIKAETGTTLTHISQEEAVLHSQWYLDTVEAFCRHKAMEQLVWDGPDLIQAGKYAELEQRSKENMLISLQKDMGTNYFHDPLARLQRMRDRTGMTSTGWRDIDRKLYGGMNRGELTFFAGGPGTGKSLFLQNLALNWVQMGLNVVYITLELSEELVGLRFDAMIAEMATKDIWKSLEDTAMKVGVCYKRNKWGKLYIKKMSEAGTKAHDINAYLKEYEIHNGFKPDAICVDYLDLLHPNSGKVGPSDLFVKDKYTSEELRSLASEWNVLAATASQLNRASISENSLDQSHIAGGISKINTADNVLGIFVNQTMKEIGQYQIQFLKTRSSSGVGSQIMLKFNLETLRIVDYDENDTPTTTSAFSSITKELKARTPQSVVKAIPTPAEVEDEAAKGEAAKAQGASLRDRFKKLNT